MDSKRHRSPNREAASTCRSSNTIPTGLTRPAKIQDINYIKRLTGLPGDTHHDPPGGDLVSATLTRRPKKYNIIRKMERTRRRTSGRALVPRFECVSNRASPDPELGRLHPKKLSSNSNCATSSAFPWSGAERRRDRRAKLGDDKALDFDGTTPVDLKYKFPRLEHLSETRPLAVPRTSGCARCESRLAQSIKSSPTASNGATPNSRRPQEMEAVVSNTWEGSSNAPTCKHILLPAQPRQISRSEPHCCAAAGNPAPGRRAFSTAGSILVGDLKKNRFEN